MTSTIRAVYEDGVFRPTEPIDLSERSVVEFETRPRGSTWSSCVTRSSGPLDSHGQAERAGYARFGLGPLFIKQMLAEESVAEVTRDFTS